MRDEVILRMLQDASAKLEHVRFPASATHIGPVYNGLLAAVAANHPNHPFLGILSPLPDGEASPEELKVLFGQLRILLETIVEEANETRTRAAGPGFGS